MCTRFSEEHNFQLSLPLSIPLHQTVLCPLLGISSSNGFAWHDCWQTVDL